MTWCARGEEFFDRYYLQLMIILLLGDDTLKASKKSWEFWNVCPIQCTDKDVHVLVVQTVVWDMITKWTEVWPLIVFALCSLKVLWLHWLLCHLGTWVLICLLTTSSQDHLRPQIRFFFSMCSKYYVHPTRRFVLQALVLTYTVLFAFFCLW